MSPEEIARGDRLAGRYLAAVLAADPEGMRAALGEVGNGVELWDLVDALGALVRAVMADLAADEGAMRLVRHRLLLGALTDAER